jgi:hypothetical protein
MKLINYIFKNLDVDRFLQDLKKDDPDDEANLRRSRRSF